MMPKEEIKGSLTRDESVPTVPRPGDYYQKVVAYDGDEELPVGELVLIIGVEGDEIDYVCGEHSYSWDVASFMQHFQFDPDGEEKRGEEMRALRSEIKGLQREAHDMQQEYEGLGNSQIGASSPSLRLIEGENAAGDESGALQPRQAESNDRQSVALVALPEEMSRLVETTKLGAANVRNRVDIFLKGVAAKKKRLDALMKEMESALDALDGLKKIARAAEKLIAILNVYLGHDEEIVEIRGGEPAAINEKIAVRQLVLYADEECAIASEDGGIDWESLERFDEWIAEPEHLRQVLPEARGLVAIKPRRRDKDYGEDRVANAIFNARNKKTYFLLRNGEQLYRISSTVEVGSNLFPTATEFDELFFTNETDWDTRERKRVRLRPGSRAFARALEEADEKERHYGTVLLMLQGLIDRTDVYQPLPGESINVMDRANHESYIRYIHDAENLLATGKQSFRKWQRELNERLDVGHRIIGIFNAYGSGLQYSRDGGRCSRLWPQRAERPENLALHTIERREGADFIFLYERNETIWTRSRYESSRESKVRASCRIETDDDFILNYDLAEIEDMRFYLTNRIDRGDYVSMFPLLKTCIRLKEQEKEEERPFRELLIGQIMREHSATLEDAEARVDELIQWYKLKNHVHRALIEDDSKALRMIVKEFELRRRRDAEREAAQSIENQIVARLRDGQPEVIYVGHKSANTYVALLAENNENIFVKEQSWQRDPSTGELSLKEETRWRVVDQRRRRWKSFWTGERWETWNLDARRNRFLTDEEIDALIPLIWKKVESREAMWHDRQTGAARQQAVCWPLALSLSADHKSLYAWYADKKALVPRSNARLTERDGIRSPNLSRMEFSWKRDRSGQLKLTLEREQHCSYDRSKDINDRTWRQNVIGIRMSENFSVGSTNNGKILLWEDEAAIERFDNEWKRMKQGSRKREQFNETVRKAVQLVEAEMLEMMEREARRLYDRDHGAPELWPEHLKKLHLREPDADGFRKAAARVLREGGAVDGETVLTIVERAAALGIEIEADEYRKLPLKLVIDFKKLEVEEEEEDDE